MTKGKGEAQTVLGAGINSSPATMSTSHGTAPPHHQRGARLRPWGQVLDSQGGARQASSHVNPCLPNSNVTVSSTMTKANVQGHPSPLVQQSGKHWAQVGCPQPVSHTARSETAWEATVTSPFPAPFSDWDSLSTHCTVMLQDSLTFLYQSVFTNLVLFWSLTCLSSSS